MWTIQWTIIEEEDEEMDTCSRQNWNFDLYK